MVLPAPRPPRPSYFPATDKQKILKLSGASSGESSIPREGILNILRSLTPRHAVGNALAAGFKRFVSYSDSIPNGAAIPRRSPLQASFRAGREKEAADL